MTARLELMDQVVSCEGCELHAQCTAPVFMSMPSSASATFSKAAGLIPKIAILGEAPGQQEDEQGAPFVGPAGQMLRQHLIANDIKPDEIAFVNTVSCFPNGTPTWDHIHACAKNREDQLAFSEATHVLCVGKVATKAINVNLDMKHGRGRPWVQDDRIYMSTYHPAAALRNSNYEQAMADDIATFARLAKPGTDWHDFVNLSCAECPKDMYWMQENGLTWCIDHVPSPDFAKAQASQERNQGEVDRLRAERGARRPRLTDDALIDRDDVPVGNNHPQTSKDAAAKALPKSGSRRREIYETIKAAGVNGMTDKELQAQMDLAHEAESGARNSLMNDGQIFDSGLKRENPATGNPTTVWVIEEFAPQDVIDAYIAAKVPVG